MTRPMPAACRARRTNRPWLPPHCAVLALAAALLGSLAPPAGGAVDPTPLGGTASSSPGLQVPAGEPQALVLPAVAPGATAPAVVRGEGKVAAGKPVPFVFRATVAGLVSIGVSSPQSAARIEIFLGNDPRPSSGTSQAEGAIRWSSEVAVGDVVKIVVYTAGEEIPFRVEVVGGAGGI
jgi:hypothetical protein